MALKVLNFSNNFKIPSESEDAESFENLLFRIRIFMLYLRSKSLKRCREDLFILKRIREENKIVNKKVKY